MLPPTPNVRGRPALDCERNVGIESLKPLGRSGPPPGTDAPCIGCNRCEPQCPESLAPQHLLRLIRAGHLSSAAETGLDRCIECRLCDRACPSGIPLAHLFRTAKDERRVRADRHAQATAAKARFDARNARLQADETDAHARRAQRLAAGSGRQW
ncbi:MAG: 4Fe-4S dicluster domain-containing protein [Gammaproteobacteria bacterium]|nr:4Fe-4S dicluster domain-containing protein [Gammaproteobacteria bacterium]